MLLLGAWRCTGNSIKSNGVVAVAALLLLLNTIMLLYSGTCSLLTRIPFFSPLSYIWVVSNATNAAGNKAEMDLGNEFEILEENLEIMALFFSCSLSIPQGVLISLNNLTFSSMLCFLSYKQMLCLPLCDIQHPLCIEKKVRQIMLFFPISSESDLDCTGLTCSLVGIQVPGWILWSKSKTKPKRFLLCVLCHPLILTVCLFWLFFPISPEVVKTLLSEVSGILLWFLQSFFH